MAVYFFLLQTVIQTVIDGRSKICLEVLRYSEFRQPDIKTKKKKT